MGDLYFLHHILGILYIRSSVELAVLVVAISGRQHITEMKEERTLVPSACLEPHLVMPGAVQSAIRPLQPLEP